MPRIDKSLRREAQRDSRRFNRTVSRAFVHTLDRLEEQRRQDAIRKADRRAAQTAKAAA